MSWECDLSIEILQEFAARQEMVSDIFLKEVTERLAYKKMLRARVIPPDRRAYNKARYEVLRSDPEKFAEHLQHRREYQRARSKMRRSIKREINRLIPIKKPKPISREAREELARRIESRRPPRKRMGRPPVNRNKASRDHLLMRAKERSEEIHRFMHRNLITPQNRD